MAQQVKDMMGRMGKGPAGLSTGLKLLVAGGALAYGVRESIYTGKNTKIKHFLSSTAIRAK